MRLSHLLQAIFFLQQWKHTVGCTLLCTLSTVISFCQQGGLPDTVAAVHSLEEVVVSASRLSEKHQTAPVSISKLSARQIATSPSPSFFEAIGSLKGVHLITPSLGFRILNTRGFSNTTNVRFVQLIDGIDNQSPHLGAPIADALSPSDLDIANVEVIQGVASALYGMNATNGLANFLTKDAFAHPGLSVQQLMGVNHLTDPIGVGPKIYSETNLRWATVLARHWALKVNLGYNRGYDWVADNTEDLNASANLSTGLAGEYNPGYDGVNSYGNESSNRRTLTLNGKNYVVARTGYRERDVADYRLENKKGDVTLSFRPTEATTLSYTYRAAQLNTIYQRSNRFRLQDYFLQQHVLQYKSALLQVNAYVNQENTGASYNLRSMAENLDVRFKETTAWYNDYTTAYHAASNTTDPARLHQLAREAADQGRYQPRTQAFNAKLKELQDINNWDSGAALRVKANLVHGEAKLDLGRLLHTAFQFQVGADARDYVIVPDGNYFINPSQAGANLHYASYGFFAHASESFLKKKLQVSLALRGSKYRYFALRWNPRLTAVYSLPKESAVRFSYQNGYRFPSIFEGFSNINSGGVKRVGGLKVMSEGVFENLWLKSSLDAFVAAVNKDVNSAGMSQTAALEKNKGLLQRSAYTYLKPESMHSVEAGYRTMLLKRRLFVDVDLYYNLYANFIAQIEGSIPNTSDSTRVPASLYDRTRQNRYRLWTNSKSEVRNYGAAMELRFLLDHHYSFFGNASYQTLKKTSRDDGLEDGFNTPSWIVNAGVSGSRVYKSLGFSLTGKYQSRYKWQSFLVNGDVPSNFNVDGMLQVEIKKPFFTVKLGASNVLNRYYYSILGGPQIGGFYYVKLTYNL